MDRKKTQASPNELNNVFRAWFVLNSLAEQWLSYYVLVNIINWIFPTQMVIPFLPTL